MTPIEACICMNMVPKVGPVRMRSLIERFGTADKVLTASFDQLRSVHGVGEEIAKRISRWQDFANLESELKAIREIGATVLTSWCEAYPKFLRQIYDPPIVLYIWGAFDDRDAYSIGIVGSRNPSFYGLECARRFTNQLARTGITIVSGLARGIDTAAHREALLAKGRTIAVLGCGLNQAIRQKTSTWHAKLL